MRVSIVIGNGSNNGQNEGVESVTIYRRLAEAAVLHGEGSEGLLQDPALQLALDWRQRFRPNAAWGQRYHPEFGTAMEYLEQSRVARKQKNWRPRETAQ